jgi:hypothetical protein
LNRKRGEDLLKSLLVSPIGPEHVDDLASLHYSELYWSFNGQLGLDHIKGLYATLVKSPFFFGHIIFSHGAAVGFTTATTNIAAMRRDIAGAYRGKRTALFSYLLRHPIAAIGVFESLFLVPFFFKRAGASAEWLTFITDTKAGFIAPLAALRLIDAVRDEFKARGVEVYAAQVVKKNPRAMFLYKKLGWKVGASLAIHNIYVYRSDAPDVLQLMTPSATNRG